MSQEAIASAFSGGPVDVERAEAALVEHYPRLVRIAYLVLPPGGGRKRRVLLAHAVVQRALPRGRTSAESALPARRAAGGADPGYTFVLLRVLRAALAEGRARGPRWARRWSAPLPRVWGLQLFPRSGGADELALDLALAELSPPARAAHVLRALEALDDRDVRRVLVAAGVRKPQSALAEADTLAVPGGSRDELLLASPEFDACSLQARPTDLLRRRQHLRVALAATAAVLVCGALLAMPDGGWGPDGPAAPAYARNPAVEKALDPASLVRAGADDWRTADRRDFAVWPARGDRAGDRKLLRRALAVWARPGPSVQVSATPGTPSGPPAGPARLLYAGTVDRAAVVLFHDGLRLVRYAEPPTGPEGGGGGAALDFARTDAADGTTATAVVAGRTDGNVRYLTAPWVSGVRQRDLLRPEDSGKPLRRDGDGMTAPVRSPDGTGRCGTWPALDLRAGSGDTTLATDLGELVPARLTYGSPDRPPGGAPDGAARASWARTACLLPSVRSAGVRTVNSWRFASQRLPGGGASADWVCTRAETWRGPGSRVLAQFQPPAERPGTPGAVAARAENSPACGARTPRVLAGVRWKSGDGTWYVLAAGSRDVVSVSATGGVRGEEKGRLLALRSEPGAKAELEGRTADGDGIRALR